MKKLLSISMAVVLGAALLTGCGGKGAEEDTADSRVAEGGSKSAETADSAEKVVLRYMTWEDGDWQNFTQDFIDQYMKDHPNVEIQYEPTAGSEYMPKLKAALAAGNEPDIMWVDQWVDLYQADLFEDLKPLAEAAGYDLSQHSEEHLKMATYNDKLYGLTGWAGAFAIVYNKELFDQAGIAYPEPGWTWEDCYNAAKAVTSGSGADKIFGINTPMDYINEVENFMWNGDAYLIDENGKYDGVLNSENMVEALEWYTKFTKEGLSPEPGSLTAMGGPDELFKQGKIAMIYKTSGYIESMKKSGEFDIEKVGTVITPVKTKGEKPAVNVLLTNPISISKNSEHKEEAFKFLAARVGYETQKEFCAHGWTIPNNPEIVKELGIMDDPLLEVFGDTIVTPDNYRYPKSLIAYSPMSAEIQDLYLTAVNKIAMNDDVDIQAELDSVVDEVKKAEANK